MINFNKRDAVADAVKSILSQEETDVNDRTKEELGGVKKTKQKDDVAPSSDGKSTKVRFHAGPKNEEVVVEGEKAEKVLVATKPTSIEKKEGPEPRSPEDLVAGKQNKKLGVRDSMKEERVRFTKTLKSFKEEYESNSIIDQMINEVLAKDASAGEWIHDFVHSDNPKFAGKSKAKRKEMALAAYYAKQKNEEVEEVDEALKGGQKKLDKNHNNKLDAQDFKILRGEKKVEEGVLGTVAGAVGNTVKTAAKGAMNVVKSLGGPDDEGQRKNLQKKMGIPQTGKIGMAKQNEETVEEGWDDMVKAAKDSVKSGPKPSGGSGVKLGTRYGGGKQKEEPEEKKEVKEAKQPDQDNVPFAPPYNTTSSPAVKDKSGATHTPMSRVKHLARQAMKKVKSDLGK